MDASLAVNEFKQGLQLLRNQCPGNAVPFLRRAVELDRDNPYYLSFLGLAVARALGKLAEAEWLCATAVQLKNDDARLYLNLADVYAEGNRRADACRALRAGLKVTGPNALLFQALGRLQHRRSPVVPFLRRGHFLNRHLGRLRHQVIEFCDRHWRPY
jgi:Flp pilus assembly protein TadD